MAITRPRTTIVLLTLLGISITRGAFAFTPNDPFLAHQWYLDRIGAPAAWDIVTGNPDSVVAVLDVGVDLDHPDLRDAIWRNPDEVPGNGIDDDRNGFTDDVVGWDFIGNDADPSPDFDISGSNPRDLHHGTIVAGIIAARGDNRQGIAGLDWKARIMPLRVLQSDGSGDVERVIAAFRYALREGATIVNLSFVGEDRATELEELITEAVRRGVLVVAAGGNEDRTGKGDLDRFPVYPICSGLDGVSVLGVAATDREDRKAAFSSYGRCVDLVAPGEQIVGTLFHDPEQIIVKLGSNPSATTFNVLYGGFFSGTSFAAPIAAGAASLLRAVLPSATPADLIWALQATADPIVDNGMVAAGQLGAGRLNVGRALAQARAHAAAIPSAIASRVTVATPLASLGEAVGVRVELRNERGEPIIGRVITVRSHRAGDVINPSALATDRQGVAVFTVRAAAVGIAELDVTVDGTRVGSARMVFATALERPIGSGALLRGSQQTVYLIAQDGKRYLFPDHQTFRSWYADANGVSRVPDDILAAFPLGGLLTIRPGTFLVKIQTDSKVYAVEPGGTLRWVPSEVVARSLMGEQWARRVVDVPETFFPSYQIGAPLTGDTHPTGTLLEDARDGERYLSTGGQRRRFTSTLAFLQNGFQWRDVIRVPVVGYPDGPPIVAREVALAQPIP